VVKLPLIKTGTSFIGGESQTVYNIYTAAIDSRFEDVAAGLGLGVHIPLQQLFLNLEAIGSGVSTLGILVDQDELLIRARIY